MASFAHAAEPFPSRPLRIVVSLGAGGVMDTVVRQLADILEPSLGQPVVVENRPGASGNIAAEFVARAPADGHTLLAAATALTVLPTTLGARAVDPVRALAPVTKLATQPVLIVAHPSLPVATLADVVALAKASPQALAYATSGVATSDHLAAVMLEQRAGIEMVHVPYVNIGQEVKDLLAGEVKLAFILLGTAQPYLRTGQLRAIAVTGSERTAALPGTPTVAETGFPGYEIMSWYGLLAPAGTPPDVVARLQREVATALATPVMRESFAAKGLSASGNSPEAFTAELAGLVRSWRGVVTAAGLAAQ
jgi:tripartite-type tricarboxylate transporter receptor subunit TctC